MERPNKSKSLFLKFLPNPSFSPSRDHHHHHSSTTKLKSQAYKGFSGPLNFSSLPDEAQTRPNKGESSFHAQDPTSPKVSCMGQIKQKHKKKKLIKKATSNNNNNKNKSQPSISARVDHPKKSSYSFIDRFFSGGNNNNNNINKSSSEEHGNNNNKGEYYYPSLGHMRKFASGRDTLANFDWTAQIAPLDHDRECYSDDEDRRRESNNNNSDDDEIIIPFSAPILMGGGKNEPRKEINIWKRRTMTPPTPLTLNSKVR